MSRLARAEADLARLHYPDGGRSPGRTFQLHDTFGLRPDFVEDVVKNYGFDVDRDGLRSRNGQAARARAGELERRMTRRSHRPSIQKLRLKSINRNSTAIEHDRIAELRSPCASLQEEAKHVN